jgi:hypothetical protein
VGDFGERKWSLLAERRSEIGSYAEYTAFGERLRALGFSEDASEGAPLCRWIHSGTILDVMPLDERIPGFSNRWYRVAMDAATPVVSELGDPSCDRAVLPWDEN